MSLDACADLLRRGDPHRFRAVLAAPAAARRTLLPLYAFNLEVTRAPWAASEPLIAEMRLQWWRDALDEIATGRPVRRHEVATPLSKALDARAAHALTDLVEARRWDAWREPHEDGAALLAYIERTAGTLTATAAHLLGATDTDPFRRAGTAAGLARYFLAVPGLITAGRTPFPDQFDIGKSASDALQSFRTVRRRKIPRRARSALNETVGTVSILRRAAGDPAAVVDGRLARPDAAIAARLFLLSLTG